MTSKHAAVAALVLAALSGGRVAAAGADAPAVDAKKFQQWATLAAKGKGLSLCRGGVARFSPQQKPASFVVFRQETDGDTRYALVVAWAGQRRAFLTDPILQDRFDCVSPFKWENTSRIKLGPWGQVGRFHAELAVVDDQLAVLHTSAEESDTSEGTGWEDLRTDGHWPDENLKRAASLLLVLDARSPWRGSLPAPQTWTTFSKPPHGGPTDASLSARVDLVGRNLRVELQAKDDVIRLPADAKVTDSALLKTDHYELWFCAPGADACERKNARQLAVARTAAGPLLTRWLHPKGNKERLPLVEAGGAGGAALIVTLPLDQLRHKGSPDAELEGELTVAYSDADVEGKGQEAIVATSDFRWGKGNTFGRFVRHAGGARFPAWTGEYQFGEDEAFLDRLPAF